MRRLLAVSMILFAAACGSSVKSDTETPETSPPTVETPRDVQAYLLPDGRTVVCIVTAWGVSCDWDSAT